MKKTNDNDTLKRFEKECSDKFVGLPQIFSNIHKGNRIFISTGCSEPQYLVNKLVEYAEKNPKAFFDAEVYQVWTLGVAPYTDDKFKSNFRHNSFFVGDNTRTAVNKGNADYTPIFLSQVPDLIYKKLVPIDVALIQASLPDSHGFMSLGVSVDIVKSATEMASLVVVQINENMPRTQGDGFVHINDVDFIVHHDEPILEYAPEADSDVSQKIGQHVSKLIEDGDTIQVGYGSIPNAVMSNLYDKKHLGVHTELISDGIVDLIKKGVVDNSKKSVNRGKTIASFSMGKKSTYDFINDNPSIKFRTIDYTNNPINIAQNDNIVAINSALEIDLTGQSTAECIGNVFYSGVGGQADFMRGAVLAKNGKTILALQSTAENGKVSRIVPFLKEGAGVTLHRSDVRYVVTEYGIAYLHGKNIRERAMELISIAHPKFRSELINQAKKHNLIYEDQAFIPGKKGEYPEELEVFKVVKNNYEMLLRPVKLSDESLLKDFFYSLSDDSMYKRFISTRKDMPHERLQDFCVIDYSKEMIILAIEGDENNEKVVGIGQFGINDTTHTAEVAFVVRDDSQEKGIGAELLNYLTHLAKKRGLLGFTAEVLMNNQPMLHLFEKMGFDIQRNSDEGVYELKMAFRS